jgi:hypothetical protein
MEMQMPLALEERTMPEVPEKPSRAKAATSENRVHIAFPDAMRKRLEEVKVDSDMGSLSEVFRQAIKFYLLAYEEHKRGSDFLIRNKDGDIERLRLFM